MEKYCQISKFRAVRISTSKFINSCGARQSEAVEQCERGKQLAMRLVCKKDINFCLGQLTKYANNEIARFATH